MSSIGACTQCQEVSDIKVSQVMLLQRNVVDIVVALFKNPCCKCNEMTTAVAHILMRCSEQTLHLQLRLCSSTVCVSHSRSLAVALPKLFSKNS